MRVALYLERARECSELADQAPANDKKAILEIAEAWLNWRMLRRKKKKNKTQARQQTSRSSAPPRSQRPAKEEALACASPPCRPLAQSRSSMMSGFRIALGEPSSF